MIIMTLMKGERKESKKIKTQMVDYVSHAEENLWRCWTDLLVGD